MLFLVHLFSDFEIILKRFTSNREILVESSILWVIKQNVCTCIKNRSKGPVLIGLEEIVQRGRGG